MKNLCSKSIKKAIALALCIALAVTLLVGCGSKTEGSGTANNGTASSSTANSAAQPSTVSQRVTFPLKDQITLTYFAEFPANLAKVTAWEDLPLTQELQKRTNIKFDFITPATGQGEQVLGIRLASGEVPDIIQAGFSQYTGGKAKAASDGLLLDYTEYLNDDCLPNLNKLLKANPAWLADIKISDKLITFPFINDLISTVARGPAVRDDWMKELNLKDPETIDDWYNMLKTFKDKKGANAPLSFFMDSLKDSKLFLGAYGIGWNFYMDNGTVKYANAESAYKDVLATFNKWFQEGLIDFDFAINKQADMEAKILNNSAGVYIGTGGSVPRLTKSAKKTNADFELKALQYPVLKAGDPVPRFLRKDSQATSAYGNCFHISAKTKYIKEALAFVDYGYGEEGSELYSLGWENQSYKVVNGKKQLLDDITKNPDGFSLTQSLYRYARGVGGGSYKVSDDCSELAQDPLALSALSMWAKGVSEYTKNNPDVHDRKTQDETNQIATKAKTISDYTDEMFIKFVTGQEPLSNFDSYVAKLKSYGLDEVTGVWQVSNDRYIKEVAK